MFCSGQIRPGSYLKFKNKNDETFLTAKVGVGNAIFFSLCKTLFYVLNASFPLEQFL